MRTSYNIHVEHAIQFDIVDVFSFSLNKPEYLLFVSSVTHATDFFRCLYIES